MGKPSQTMLLPVFLAAGLLLIGACGDAPPPKKETRPEARTDRAAPRPVPAELPADEELRGAPADDSPEGKVAKYIQALETGGVEARKEALVRLAALADTPLEKAAQAALRPIRECLRHTAGAVRANAALALLKLEGTEAIPSIQPLLKDESEEVRLTVLNELGKLGSQFSSDLMAGLDDPSPDIQEIVLDQLARQGWKRADGSVVKLFERTDAPRVRAQALAFLLAVKSDLGVAAVLQVLEDLDDASTLTLAVRYLGQYGKPAQMKKLVPFLMDREVTVRREVVGIVAAREVKTLDSVAGLIRLLEDEAEEVRQAAHDALKKLTSQDFGFDPNEWDEEKVRPALEKWEKWLTENRAKLPEN
ncbi:MAG: HEAT repeat domain-containing protein [Planctomycetes bacterium]|nr:HEAT repeat domain-containing protein [Planctomycetota bacterium]